MGMVNTERLSPEQTVLGSNPTGGACNAPIAEGFRILGGIFHIFSSFQSY